MAFGFGGVGVGIIVGDDLGYAKGRGVEGCLRDEAVGKGDPEKTGDTGSQAEEEEIPVEAGGLAEGEFGTLGDEGGN